MTRWPVVAALLAVAMAPSASAGGSSVDLTGADRLDASFPTSMDIGIRVVLESVVCTSDADVRVQLRVADMQGIRTAELSWDSVLFRIAPHQATAQPWHGESEVALRVWAAEPTGSVSVVATYALPPQCRALGGGTSGESTHTVLVDGPAPRPPPPPIPQAPVVGPKSGSLLDLVTQGSLSELPRPPMPVLGAILGMIAGGGVVFWNRMRAFAPRAG